MILSLKNLSKSYGVITVLDNVSCTINDKNRVGLVGSNGVGKSTLLHILTGQEEADRGTITYAPSIEIGYLPQTTPIFYGRTIQDLILESIGNLRLLEERMHALETEMATSNEEHMSSLLVEYNAVSTQFQDRGGYDIDYKIDAIMEGLELTYLPRSQEMDTLSGGEKERVGLAALLLRSPDLLLLDEPTNHLDSNSLAWLETYLHDYSGAALIVSHDRQFLNRAVTSIFEIDEYEHNLKKYEGNYDAYVQARNDARRKWEEEYERQQEEIKELRKRVKDGARNVGHSSRTSRDNDKYAVYFFEQQKQQAVSRNVRAAEEQLKRLEANAIPKPTELLRVNSHFHTDEMHSQQVIAFSHLSKSFGKRHILYDLNGTVGDKARILLTGPNGTGKTTLFKIIMGLEKPDEGVINVVSSAKIGYLAQEPEALDLNKTVIETYKYDQIGYEGEFVGKLLGYGLFRLEDMHKKVGQLSVGQRRKLEIARLMAARPTVLLLDEPTNYISLDVLEAFEEAIMVFQGPVLVISHDRWFIERFGGKKWELIEGKLVKHE